MAKMMTVLGLWWSSMVGDAWIDCDWFFSNKIRNIWFFKQTIQNIKHPTVSGHVSLMAWDAWIDWFFFQQNTKHMILYIKHRAVSGHVSLNETTESTIVLFSSSSPDVSTVEPLYYSCLWRFRTLDNNSTHGNCSSSLKWKTLTFTPF